jgi:hypothetical protein
MRREGRRDAMVEGFVVLVVLISEQLFVHCAEMKGSSFCQQFALDRRTISINNAVWCGWWCLGLSFDGWTRYVGHCRGAATAFGEVWLSLSVWILNVCFSPPSVFQYRSK